MMSHSIVRCIGSMCGPLFMQIFDKDIYNNFHNKILSYSAVSFKSKAEAGSASLLVNHLSVKSSESATQSSKQRTSALLALREPSLFNYPSLRCLSINLTFTI